MLTNREKKQKDNKLSNTRWGRLREGSRFQGRVISEDDYSPPPKHCLSMMCYDLVELFLPFIFSGRKPKPFAILQVPSGRLSCKTNFRDLLSPRSHFVIVSSDLTTRSKDVIVMHRKLLVPSFLSL